jgi:hypothetical protein
MAKAGTRPAVSDEDRSALKALNVLFMDRRHDSIHLAVGADLPASALVAASAALQRLLPNCTPRITVEESGTSIVIQLKDGVTHTLITSESMDTLERLLKPQFAGAATALLLSLVQTGEHQAAVVIRFAMEAGAYNPLTPGKIKSNSKLLAAAQAFADEMAAAFGLTLISELTVDRECVQITLKGERSA